MKPNTADITTRFQEAWNTHDMEAFGRLFHPGATFVHRFATYWRGSTRSSLAARASMPRSTGIRRFRSTRLISIRSRIMQRSCTSGRGSAPVPRIRPGRIRSTH